MAETLRRGRQVRDGAIQRDDLDVSTAGQAVIRKVIAGTNISLTYTGTDSGTGDVTINATLDVYSKAEVYTKSETDAKLDNPAFSAYVAANQTITSSTYTKVNFNTEEFDIGSCYDTTNKRWTPNKAGYYQVSMTVNNITSVSPSVFVASIYKNGSSFKQGGDMRGTNACAITSSALIYMNGTTDYLEGFAYITATTPTIAGGSNISYFSAYFVRA